MAETLIETHTSEELDDLDPQEVGFGRWLNCLSRCFGDKGDVEDITEG